jgi:uroporphyrinogen decarboxylase
MSEESGHVKRLVSALNREPIDRPPIWLMRQAGRYLPEYRELRSKAGKFLDLCYNPDLAAEVTLQPLRRFSLDAAIIFSDILVIPHAAGNDLDFVENIGPVLSAIRNSEDISSLNFYDVKQKLEPVYKAVSITKANLNPGTALIGFAGAPWTIASYLIEGGTSRDFLKIRKWIVESPDTLSELFSKLEDAITQHLIAQIDAGADVVQIFDSWSGILGDGDFENWSILPIMRICRAVKASHPNIPIIVFPRLAGLRYQKFLQVKEIDGLSIDQTISCSWARKELYPQVSIQGNLDPIFLLGPTSVMKKKVSDILDVFGSNSGFVFNLGHGVHKDTNPETVAMLCDFISSWRKN